MTKFDDEKAREELAWIKHERQQMRPQNRSRSRSKLEPYRAELVELRKAGASLQDIVVWLKKRKRTKVNRTTVYRKLLKWPESPDYRE